MDPATAANRAATAIGVVLSAGLHVAAVCAPSLGHAHSADFFLTEENRAALKSVTVPRKLDALETLEVRRAVRQATLRPDTVRFGDIMASQAGGESLTHVCGYVDGAGLDGVMTGYRPFYLLLFDGFADADRVEIASPEFAAEHSDCGGAAPPTIECAFVSVERFLRDAVEKEPSANAAEPEEIEAYCRAVNIEVAPPDR